MDSSGLEAALVSFSLLSGTALIIWTSMKMKIARIKAEAEVRRLIAMPLPQGSSDSTVLTELKAMRQQMEQMQSTSHSFDLSFDEALNRLEGRINRLETKSAVTTATPATDTTPNTLRNGQS